MKNVLRPTLVLTATLCLAAGVFAGPALATSGGATGQAVGQIDSRGRGDYLALGDSVPFGYSPLLAIPGPASRYVGYPELAAPLLGLSLTNLACPGETSGSYLDTSAPDNGCRAFRAGAALHNGYTGAQGDAAVAFLKTHRDTRLVTLMIGANDLFLCEKAGTCGPNLGTALTTIDGNLQSILDRIRYYYSGRLVLVSYYSTDYTDPTGTAGAQALDGVLAAQATSHGAEVANGFTAFQKIASLAGGKTCSAHLLIALPTGGCDIHPSRLGAGVLAGTVVVADHQRAA